jgi:hypothetical protein
MGNAGGCLASASAWGVARVCGHQPRVLCTSRQLRQVLGGGPETQGSDTGPGHGINGMAWRREIQCAPGTGYKDPGEESGIWDQVGSPVLGQVGQGKGCLGKPKFLFCAANLRSVPGSFMALCMWSISPVAAAHAVPLDNIGTLFHRYLHDVVPQ